MLLAKCFLFLLLCELYCTISALLLNCLVRMVRQWPGATFIIVHTILLLLEGNSMYQCKIN